MSHHIIDKWKAFCEWQQRPYQVAQKSPELHLCHTCGEEFLGNYCPRCGQSAKIGRYSFKKAFLLFLDVWGMGNRGMFRTLRDLILRPGYMIRDYISGMQMAYFPPFKLLFLLTALSLIVDSGFNLEDKGFLEKTTEQTEKASGDIIAKEGAKQEKVKDESSERTFEEIGSRIGTQINEFYEEYPNLYKLSLLFGMSVFIYFFVWRCPNIPDLRYSELLVALVYILDMCSIYHIVFKFLNIPAVSHEVLYLLSIIPLKQMTGFKWWRTFLVVLLSYLYVILIIFIALFAGYFLLK